jgi:hypothetical protein
MFDWPMCLRFGISIFFPRGSTSFRLDQSEKTTGDSGLRSTVNEKMSGLE